MGWPAGEDKPRRMTGHRPEAPQRRKRRAPVMGKRTTSDPIGSPFAVKVGALARTRSLPQAEADITQGRSVWPAHPESPGVLPGPQQCLSRLAIVQAIQPGLGVPASAAYLRAVLSDPVIAALRADAAGPCSSWPASSPGMRTGSTMTSWRPRELACAEIGSSRDPSSR